MCSTELVLTLEESEGNAEIKKTNWKSAKKFVRSLEVVLDLCGKTVNAHIWKSKDICQMSCDIFPTKVVTTIDTCGLMRRQKYSCLTHENCQKILLTLALISTCQVVCFPSCMLYSESSISCISVSIKKELAYRQFFFNGHGEKKQTLSTAYKKHMKSFSHEGSRSNSPSTDTQQLQNVINLSSKTLTDKCLIALTKGYSFIPTTYCGLSQVLLDLKTEKKNLSL